MAEEKYMIRAKGRNEYEREKKTWLRGCDASDIGDGVRVGRAEEAVADPHQDQ